MRHKIPLLAACAAVVLGLSGAVIALEKAPAIESAANTIIKNPRDNRHYDAFFLDNGMEVLVVSDPDTAVSAATLVVGVGSYQNPESQPGLAHYLEHMLFLGTKKYPEANGFNKFVSVNSGYVNAVTNLQDTKYLFAIPNQKYDEALDYFSDYFKEPLFDTTYSEKERSAINAEWSGGRSDDARIGARILALSGNPQHPFAKFPVGNLATLKDKEGSNLHQEMIKFYRYYYSANLMKLVLVGNQPITKLKALAQKHFASITNKNTPAPSIDTPGLLPENMHKVISYRPHMDVKRLVLQFSAKDNAAQWNLKPNEYVQRLMVSNEPGTLAHYLNEKKLADRLFFEWETKLYGNSGTYTITIDLTKNGLSHRDDVIAATFSYLNLIREQGINEIYFSELKYSLDMDYKNETKSDALSTANSLANSLLEGLEKDILYARYRLDRFDAAAIAAVINQLTPENLRVGYISKKESVDTDVPFYDGRYKVEDITAEQLSVWADSAKAISLQLPPENPLLKRSDSQVAKANYDKPRQIINKSGARAWLMNSQYFDDSSGLMNLVIHSDTAENTARQFVLSALLSDLFWQKNDILLSRYSRAGVIATIGITDKNSQYIALSGEANKQAELMHELVSSFVTFEFSDSDLKTAKDKFKTGVANNEKSDLPATASKILFDIMLKNRWSNEAIFKAIAAVSRSDIRAYQSKIANRNTLDIFAFGYFDEKGISRVVDDSLSLMGDSRRPAQMLATPVVVPLAGKGFVVSNTSSQNDNALMDVYVSSLKSTEELTDLYIVNALFETAFYTELRTKEQLAYTLNSRVYNFNQYPALAMFIQSENTDLPALKSRFDKFRVDFLAHLTDLDPLAMEQAKQSILVQLKQKPANIEAEAATYADDFFNEKFDFETKALFIKGMQSATKERMIKTYKNILLNDNSMNIVAQIKGKKFDGGKFAIVEKSQGVDRPEEVAALLKK